MQITQIKAWNVACDLSGFYTAMTVRVAFSHEQAESDETEFCITAWNEAELDRLFREFCRENAFQKVRVDSITIVRSAGSIEELTQLEEALESQRQHLESEVA